MSEIQMVMDAITQIGARSAGGPSPSDEQLWTMAHEFNADLFPGSYAEQLDEQEMGDGYLEDWIRQFREAYDKGSGGIDAFDLDAFLAEAQQAAATPAAPARPARAPRPRRCPKGPAYDLMPDSILAKLPTEEQALRQGLDAIVQVKYFLPGTGLTWYVVGYDPEDDILYDFQCGAAHLDDEMGTVFLHELEQLSVRGVFFVERDLYFTPCTLREAREKRP